jgi:dolichyl-phosphate beta-glucosyltransferase
MFLSIIIPAYNEQDRLPGTLLATVDYFDRYYPGNYELLVVDDGSVDDTVQIVRDFAADHPKNRVSMLQYGGNKGKGYAVRYGLLSAKGDWRLFCDADLATPVEEFDVVYNAMRSANAQIGIGSRPLRDSTLLVHQPWYREALGRFFNKIVRLLAVPGIADTQCGFKIFSASAANAVFSRCKLDGFAFDAEALYVARKLRQSIVEVPIRWSHKPGSKVSMVRDGLKMLRDLALIRLMHRGLPASVVAHAPRH